MTRTAILDSPHARSGLFALIFTPPGLILLGSSMADVVAQTAIGQPLASVEGLMSMGLSAVLIGLVSFSCDESPVGMILTALGSLVFGIFQALGVLRVPLLQASVIDAADMRAVMIWSLYPLAVALITSCAAIATVIAQRPRRPSTITAAQRNRRRAHRRAWITLLSLPAGVAVIFLYRVVTPEDTTGFGVAGLSALSSPLQSTPWPAILAAVLLGLITLSSVFSLTGTQVTAWCVLILPGYIFWPLWSSLTGQIVTPGASPMTAFSLTFPIVAALGLLISTSTIGVYISRSRSWALASAHEDEDELETRPTGK